MYTFNLGDVRLVYIVQQKTHPRNMSIANHVLLSTTDGVCGHEQPAAADLVPYSIFLGGPKT